MRKQLFAFALLSCLCGSVFAGDEVDYSAPYMTLEDGKLVTKYPAKEHDPNAPLPNTAPNGTTGSSPPTPPKPTPLGIVLLVAMIALAIYLSRGKKSRHQSQQVELTE